MNVYVTTEYGGDRVTLTHESPLIARIKGTREWGVYPQPGDPLLIRHQCRAMAEALLGREIPEPLESVRCELTLEPLD